MKTPLKTQSNPRRKSVDPRRVLEEIASNSNASPALRYRAACKLIELDQRGAAAVNGASEKMEKINRRALEIMAERNRRSN